MKKQKNTKISSPRFQSPNREQCEFIVGSLESLLPDDHQVRVVWRFADQHCNLSSLYKAIKAVEGGPGRTPIDPKILMAIWLYAVIDGVSSARKLETLCREQIPYMWICGGVSINHHTLSDFRVQTGEILDELLTNTVASLMSAGVVDLKGVAHDGMRVRANAGKSSFRTREKLEQNLKIARERVKELKDLEKPCENKKKQAAQERVIREKEQRVKEAIENLDHIERHRQKKPKREPRTSTTDPEARVMKMSNGGFDPAFNIQYATDVNTGVVVGVEVINKGNDRGTASPMLEQIKNRFDKNPEYYLADGDFLTKDDITKEESKGIEMYIPVRNDSKPLSCKDNKEIAQWRERMQSEEGKEKYKERTIVEWVNAEARNRGLRLLLVRGLQKVKAVSLWYALAHNMLRLEKLQGMAT